MMMITIGREVAAEHKEWWQQYAERARSRRGRQRSNKARQTGDTIVAQPVLPH